MGKSGPARMLNQLKQKGESVGLNKCDREGRTRSSKIVLLTYKLTSQSGTMGLNRVNFTNY